MAIAVRGGQSCGTPRGLGVAAACVPPPVLLMAHAPYIRRTGTYPVRLGAFAGSSAFGGRASRDGGIEHAVGVDD